jgi:hypothetical protein
MGSAITSNIRHSRERGDPEWLNNPWIPGQARNDGQACFPSPSTEFHYLLLKSSTACFQHPALYNNRS